MRLSKSQEKALQEKVAPKFPSGTVLQFTVPGKPIGKPRMTRRDRWMKRDCVTRYWAWKDEARKAAGELPLAKDVRSVSMIATFAPPASWSKSKRLAIVNSFHRVKPDADNIIKAALDALFDEDSGIADVHVIKLWGDTDGLLVRILT